MKKILLTTLLLASSVAAQPDRKSETIKQVVPCAEFQHIAHNLINDYKEVPVAIGDGVMLVESGVNLKGKLITFINPETKSFSLVFRVGTDPSSLSCIVMAGDSFSPTEMEEGIKL